MQISPLSLLACSSESRPHSNCMPCPESVALTLMGGTPALLAAKSCRMQSGVLYTSSTKAKVLNLHNLKKGQSLRRHNEQKCYTFCLRKYMKWEKHFEGLEDSFVPPKGLRFKAHTIKFLPRNYRIQKYIKHSSPDFRHALIQSFA